MRKMSTAARDSRAAGASTGVLIPAAERFADPWVRGDRKRALDRTALLALLEGVDMVVKARRKVAPPNARVVQLANCGQPMLSEQPNEVLDELNDIVGGGSN